MHLSDPENHLLLPSLWKIVSIKPVPRAEKAGDHYLRRFPKSPDSLEDQGYN